MLETWLWLGERPDVKGSKGTVVGVIRKMGDREGGREGWGEGAGGEGVGVLTMHQIWHIAQLE